MADNTTLNSGSGGDTIATDDIAGVKHQRVKVQHGADGSATDASAASPFPVDITSQTADITIADGGNSITVDGTVTANPASGTIDTVTTVSTVTAVTDITNPITANPASGTIDTVTTVGAVTTVTNDVGVVGAAAENAAASGNPVLTGGRYDATPRTLGDGDVGGIALDADGAVHISDGGNTITVDGTVTANPASGTIDTVTTVGTVTTITNDVNIADGGNSITVDNAGLTELAAAISSSQLDVNIATDSVGIGGGTQYTEDAAAAANPVGNMPILVRNDTPASEVTTDGDNIAQRATAYGAAYTQILDSSGNFIDTFGGSGGTAVADDADFVAGTTLGTPIQGIYESSPTSVTDGDLGMVGITVGRQLKVTEANSTAILADTDNIDTNIGTIAGAVSGTEMQVDIVSGTVTANLSDTDNAVLDAIETTLNSIETAVGGTHIDDAAFTEATDDGVPIFAANNLGNIDAGDAGIVGMSVDRRLYTDSDIAIDGTSVTAGAGTVAASTPRVTLASDDPAVVALQVIDNAVATEGSALGSGVLIQGDDGTDRTNVLVDTDGHLQVDVLTGGTASTQYAEDSVHASGNTGTMALAVRNDTLASLVSTDGDYAPLQVNASGALFIQEGAAMDVSAATVTVDGSGVTQPISGTITANLSATDNTALDLVGTNTTGLNNCVSGSELQVDIVTSALPAGAATAANQVPSTSGGISTVYRDEDIDETAVALKAAAGQIYWIHCINLDATPVYLHFYNVAQGSVTVGTTGELCSFAVPSQGDANGAGFTMHFNHGIAFDTAITVACTTTIGGSAGPGANEVILNVGYA